MTNSNPADPREHLEKDALLAGEAAAGALRAGEIALVVLLVLLVCPPLAILTVVVVVPLLVIALVFTLLFVVVSLPYLLIHHYRGGGHLSLLTRRLRHAVHAFFDLAPNRIVAEIRKSHAR